MNSSIFEKKTTLTNKECIGIYFILLIINIAILHYYSLPEAILYCLLEWILLLIGYIDLKTSYIWRFMSYPVVLIGLIFLYMNHSFLSLNSLVGMSVISIILLIFGLFGLWGLGDSIVLIGLAILFFSVHSISDALHWFILLFFITDVTFLLVNIKKIFKKKVCIPFAPYIFIGMTIILFFMR